MSVLTTDQKGAIAETAIAHAAIKLGLDVYRPLQDGGRYDLIIDMETRLLRVQCKWAVLSRGAVVVRCYSSRRGPVGMIIRRYSAGEVDAIVAYCAATERLYLLEPEMFSGRRFVYLRVDPSQNNQRLGINWADDFDFADRLMALVGP